MHRSQNIINVDSSEAGGAIGHGKRDDEFAPVHEQCVFYMSESGGRDETAVVRNDVMRAAGTKAQRTGGRGK